MRSKNIFFPPFLLLSFVAISFSTFSQQIKYTEVDKEEQKITGYEIIGKMKGKILVYKNIRDFHHISVYNNEMELVEKIKLEYLTDKVFNVDFLQYQDFIYLFYQYQKRNIVYCNAVKLDDSGKKMGEIMQLDTTNVSYAVNNKIYDFLYSEDKNKIAFVKVNNTNEKTHFVTTLLFDKNLALEQKKRIGVNMPDRNDFLTEFQLNNKGELFFLRAWGSQNDNISKLTLFTKNAMSDELLSNDIKLNNTIYLDDLKIKVDNLNNKLILNSFYSKKRRGDIDGLFTILLDNKTNQAAISTNVFDNDFRGNAKGDATFKTAFNEYFLKNIIVKKDGGFIAIAQTEYTSQRGNGNNNFNRWDYMNNWGAWNMNNFYTFGGNSMFFDSPWNRWGSMNSNNITRYFSDNIAIMSVDGEGKLIWSNVIYKSQFDDNTDFNIGYGLFNTGDQLHFLYNVLEKRQNFLTDQSITPEGQLVRNATLKNLDKGYDFLPKLAKQTGSKQIIIPCMYRNYLCFAKIDY